jgi:hypothetical protein
MLLDFITRTIMGEEYRSLSSSLCRLLHSHYPILHYSNPKKATCFGCTTTTSFTFQKYTRVGQIKTFNIFYPVIYWTQKLDLVSGSGFAGFQNSEKWWARVNMAMILRIPRGRSSFLRRKSAP